MPKKADLNLKKLQTKIRAVTYLTGWAKEAFINDVTEQESNEADVLREIVRSHYERRGLRPRF